MKKYMIIFMLSFLSNLYGCGEDTENSDFQNLEQPAIYGGLNTYRTDTYQKRMALDPVDDPLKWQNIALSRSVGQITLQCVGSTQASGGSGFLIDKNTIITAKHVVDECESSVILVQFSKDREFARYNLLDDRSPNQWLLNNRIYQLSLESNFSNLDFKKFISKFEYTGTIIPPSFNDKDIAYLKLSKNIIKIQNNSMFVDPYVFFDYLSLPAKKEHNLQLLENIQLWAFSVTQDPAKKYEGNWRIFNFDPYVINDNQILDSTILISDPGYLKTFNSAEFGQPCQTGSNDKYCFKTSLDAIPKQSGGAVIHRINNSLQYYVVGILKSTKGQNNDVWETTPQENENTNDPNMIWTKATLLDDVINKPPVVPLPGEPNPHAQQPKPEGEEAACIGCDNGLIDTKIYSCHEALGENVPGIMVGFVGSPQGNNGRPSTEQDINSIGTLGIVCNQWRHTPYTERWGDLKVYGYAKALDTIKGRSPAVPRARSGRGLSWCVGVLV